MYCEAQKQLVWFCHGLIVTNDIFLLLTNSQRCPAPSGSSTPHQPSCPRVSIKATVELLVLLLFLLQTQHWQHKRHDFISLFLSINPMKNGQLSLAQYFDFNTSRSRHEYLKTNVNGCFIWGLFSATELYTFCALINIYSAHVSWFAFFIYGYCWQWNKNKISRDI